MLPLPTLESVMSAKPNAKIAMKIAKEIIGHGASYSERSWHKKDRPAKKYRHKYYWSRYPDVDKVISTLNYALNAAGLGEAKAHKSVDGDIVMLYPIGWRTGS